MGAAQPAEARALGTHTGLGSNPARPRARAEVTAKPLDLSAQRLLLQLINKFKKSYSLRKQIPTPRIRSG